MLDLSIKEIVRIQYALRASVKETAKTVKLQYEFKETDTVGYIAGVEQLQLSSKLLRKLKKELQTKFA
jgi:hypothetical protein